MDACASNLQWVFDGAPPYVADLFQMSLQDWMVRGYPQLQRIEVVMLVSLDPELGHLSHLSQEMVSS